MSNYNEFFGAVYEQKLSLFTTHITQLIHITEIDILRPEVVNSNQRLPDRRPERLPLYEQTGYTNRV